jgi:molecular chaperone GrpE (heat shock protein)
MKYKGMTVNERLYVGGFMDEFDKAVKDKDVDKVRSILKKVELTEPSIKPILESYGLSSEE